MLPRDFSLQSDSPRGCDRSNTSFQSTSAEFYVIRKTWRAIRIGKRSNEGAHPAVKVAVNRPNSSGGEVFEIAFPSFGFPQMGWYALLRSISVGESKISLIPSGSKVGQKKAKC